MALKAIYRTSIFTLSLCAVLSEKSFSQSLLAFRENKADSHEHPRNRDYSKVDSFVTAWLWNQEEYTTMKMLADTIKANFSDEADRVRAIFMWITDNISYDCEKYHQSPKPEKINANNKKEYMAALEKSDRKDAEQCFAKRKGICNDYALLFKYLCDYTGVESKVVGGYANSPHVPNQYLGRHAWNKVKINGDWYFIDATWASGYTDKKAKKFTKEFDGFYFLPAPESVAKTHFERKEKNNFSSGGSVLRIQFGNKSCLFPMPF